MAGFKPADANGLTNQLAYVKDAVGPNIYPLTTFPNEKDIDDQPIDNYTYDRIGNLIIDNTANDRLTKIDWTVYGKIRQIAKSVTVGTVTTNSIISYDYDASGNRIAKQVTTGGVTTSTYYLRDA
jgi:YD repeat-containing protein